MLTNVPVPQNPAYGLLTIVGLLVAAVLWQRLAPVRGAPPHVFLVGLIGAVVGAKVVYWVADSPFQAGNPHFWWNLLGGRTVLGALFGGYVGVELGKKLVGYRRPTGDAFAIVCPVGVFFGRIGCWLHGCCLGRVCGPAWYTLTDSAGIARWPSALVEAGFNVAFAVCAYGLYRRRVLRGQLFHVYLIAYGLFRGLHEFLRETPRVWGALSSYQIVAALLVAFAVWRFVQRRRQSATMASIEWKRGVE